MDTQTAAQHAEIMEKVEKLNELTEANKVLANEKASAEETVRELVTKVQSNSCFTITNRFPRPPKFKKSHKKFKLPSGKKSQQNNK